MKSKHQVKLGETIVFKDLGEVQEWSENHEYAKDEFECISSEPFTYKKVK